MRSIKYTSKRVLALLISALMIISMLPISIFTVFATATTALETNIAENTFYTDMATEFTFTTTAGVNAGEMVLGTFTLLDESGADAQSAVKMLEYWDVTNGCYREFYGDFGPADTGFPLTDATSRFRVTFSKAGTYTVQASIINFSDRSVLVSAEDAIINVKPYVSELTTDIDTKTFVNNTEVEFTYSTIANAQKDTMVLGTFSVLDSDSNDARNCIKKLEYWDVTNSCYREFYGDFGPADTGFPLTDATSKFRVTFSKAGIYTVNAAMKKFDDGEILCSNTQTITVQTNNSVLTTDIDTKTFEVNEEVEFTYTTTAGVNAGEMVLGTFTLLDESGADAQSAVKMLEYWDVTNGCYREFYGDFGPADTGFPLTDATSRFRVTFSKAGTYTVQASIINFSDRSVLVSAEDAIINVKPYVSELTTDIDTKTFVNNTEVEFTYSTIANAQKDTMVLGTFSVLDSDSNDARNCIKKLEYWDVTNSCYREFYGDFGPADTGFPLTDATSKFRVTFSKAGIYTVNAAMKKFDDGEILCSNTQTITVQTNNSVLTTDINTKTFEINEEVEFTYTTTANDFVDTAVLGTFSLKKDGVDVSQESVKLEYWDVTNSCYREFYGDFGPAATGFPLTDATSNFRVTFKETGTYTVVAQMVAFDGRSVLSENITTIEVKDTKAPVISDVTGNATNWTSSDVTLEVIATDNSGSVEYCLDDGKWEWQTSNQFTIEENGQYKFYAKDATGNISAVSAEVEVIYIDKTAPTIGVIVLDPDEWTNESVTVTVPADDAGVGVILYQMDGLEDDKWQTSNEFSITDNETHKFYVKDSLGNVNTVPAEIKADKYDAKAPVINSVTPDTTEWVADKVAITVDAADEGVKGIAYKLGKDGVWQSANTFDITENGTYQVYVRDALENEIATPTEIVINNIDKTKPEIVNFVSTTEKWTNNDVTIRGTVNDTQSGVVKLEMKINEGEWMDLTFDADCNFSRGPISEECDSLYTFRCYDLVGNVSDEYSKRVRIDKTAPVITDVEYSEEAQVKDDIFSKLINGITFGFIKNIKQELKVKATATDVSLSKIKIVASGKKGQYDTESVEIEETFDLEKQNEDVLTAWVDKVIPADFMGTITVTVTDMAGNSKTQTNEVKGFAVTVIDKVAPEIDIKYAAKDTDTKMQMAEGNYYYDGAVVATITVTENNFFEGIDGIHELGLKVTKTDNLDNETVTEYYPADTNHKYDDLDKYVPIEWAHNGTKHTVEILFEEDADYVLELSYKDFSQKNAFIKDSNNVSSEYSYKSNVITVDTIAPEVTVAYDNKDVKATYDARQYFIADQFATITVEEHNFRADEFKAVVTAKYSDGKTDVTVADFAAMLSDDSKWTKNGNIYTIKLDFTVDANYTFDYTYEDLAQNPAKEYVADEFTVDEKDPENLTVTYDGDVKTTILDKVLNVLTFGYYDAKVKVIITADDDISCIDHFVYSYIKGTGVSNVNASLENVVIKSDKISQNGKTFTAEFEIPKDVLQNTNQFNGTVEFNAVERSTRSTDHKETATIIVDNIAPTATITYNEPVQKVNDISYYAGNIDAKIVINEANFNSDEVVVEVNNAAVDVKWTDDSVDIHTGTFTLTQDGNYIVTVNYADRSKNAMTPYVSNQLTIDTKDPVINVSNVKHQSANNDETISFTVSVTDTNIALESFKPTLNAVIKKDNGNNSFTYETMAIALGNAATTTNANGETVYAYSVNNLEVDGFYSLVCTAVDYANHSVSIINSAADEGGNTTVETMNFSVNREGSVFWIETEHNDKYTGETLTDKLNGAYANDKVTIKLHEINVDKVDENADKKTVFTLNDGSESEDIVLEEGKNYSKNVIVGTGGWYETVYTLDNDNFDHDGVYSLNVITYDKADNSNVNTKTEAGTISFTLDRTNPVISANIKNDQSVNDTQFWVEFGITETNLDAETIVVKLTNNDGKTVETKVEDLGNNEYKFLVESGYNYSVEIVAKDLAGNESELYKVEHLTVSTNIFILWYANTPLFWGSIGGTILLAGIIILLIFLKKRKKNEK